MTCFLNGQFLSKEEVLISPCDLGFQRGLVAFEAFRTYQKIPLFLDLRIQRLIRSAETLNIPLPYELEPILEALIKDEELLIKVYATRSNFLVLTEPFLPYPDAHYERGIHAITLPPARSLFEVKTTNYASSVIALEKSGADEALYVKENGDVLEGSRSNIFILQKGIIFTPPTGEILPGITRSVVMDLKEVNMSNVDLGSLSEWDEAFITSSTRGVVPLASIDGTPIGNGAVGPVTKEVMALFQLALEEAMDKSTFGLNRVESNSQL